MTAPVNDPIPLDAIYKNEFVHVPRTGATTVMLCPRCPHCLVVDHPEAIAAHNERLRHQEAL